MIIGLLIQFALTFFGSLLNVFPNVTIASIPLIGTPASSILLTMVTSWNTFSATVPYVLYPYHAFLYALLPFEILMLLLKIFFGSRAPANNK